MIQGSFKKQSQIVKIIKPKTIKTGSNKMKRLGLQSKRKKVQILTSYPLAILTNILGSWLIKYMLDRAQEHNFPLTHQKNNLKLSTSSGIFNYGIYISAKCYVFLTSVGSLASTFAWCQLSS